MTESIKQRILASAAEVEAKPFGVADIEQYLPSRDEILQEREKTHGDFRVLAATAQGIKSVITQNPRYALLSPAHRECLDLFATKIARILSGNANEPDHWLDISGYANLGHENIKPERVK